MWKYTFTCVFPHAEIHHYMCILQAVEMCISPYADLHCIQGISTRGDTLHLEEFLIGGNTLSAGNLQMRRYTSFGGIPHRRKDTVDKNVIPIYNTA